MNNIKLLTAEEIAELLHIIRSFAYKLIRNGEIPSIQIGKSVRVRQQDLETYISENISAPTIHWNT